MLMTTSGCASLTTAMKFAVGLVLAAFAATAPASSSAFAWTTLPHQRTVSGVQFTSQACRSLEPSSSSSRLSLMKARRSPCWATRRFMSSSPSADEETSSPSKPTLEAILWDMDGVLADTERDGHRPSFNRVFEENNLDTHWDVDRYGVLLEVGGGKERMTAHWNEMGWPDALPDDGTRQSRVKEFHLRKTDIFMDMIKGGTIPLRPGVQRIVDDAIKAGIRLAVCSTSNELAVTNLVRTLLGPDRASRFRIYAGDMVANKKPAPDVYLMAVEDMGLDKSRCVIVEDSGIGLKAAMAAGVKCIVTKSSYTSREDFTGADLVVDELGDDPTTGVTLDTLASLLQAETKSAPVS